MDSLLANYASSDDEGEDEQQQVISDSPSKSPSNFNKPPKTSFLSSLPPPKSSQSSSGFSSLPPSKSLHPTTKEHSPSEFPSHLGNATKTSSIFSSLPQPKSSGFSSLPPPKSLHPTTEEDSTPKSPSHLGNASKALSIFSSLPQPKSSSGFSSLPPPKSLQSTTTQAASNISSTDLNRKRVVQFKPPINLSLLKPQDEDDDEEENERKLTKESVSSGQTSSLKSFLSNLPAPKNSLGSGASSSLGSGRRSIVEADVPTSNSDVHRAENESNTVENGGHSEGNWVDGSYSSMVGTVGGPSEFATGGADTSSWAPSNENYEAYQNYGSYGEYGGYGNYGDNWAEASTVTPATENSGMFESTARISGKRGRDGVPTEIVEVKQDELIKNRPREDQVKLTGIAFGPSYQPVASKGKPSKLHKRKHQIGSLFYDMKQREMELAERRARGFLTKAETQAKYGW
uniref:Proline-rich protein PRCC n=1 Tax=Nelumbo nucifera TaxID=4432 RepID=A0A822YPM0_NELNU|nr:TPA_asm: hypothetical protein HUJ06_011637 [Nelumbo nucifera]